MKNDTYEHGEFLNMVEELEQYKAATERFAGLVNNINNLLTVMRGQAQLAGDETTDARVEELIKAVLAGTARAKREIREALGHEEMRGIIPEDVAPSSRQARILVVDDEEPVQVLMSQILSKNGHNVHVATSAEEALKACEGEPFDIIFMDLHLGAVNGIEAFRRIREVESAAHVIFLSGDPHFQDIWKKVREEGASGFIKKPFDIVEVNNAVAYLLSQLP